MIFKRRLLCQDFILQLHPTVTRLSVLGIASRFFAIMIRREIGFVTGWRGRLSRSILK
jgi:hypothetical protein